MTHQSEPILCSLGCDYLTVTTKHRDSSARLHSHASSLFRVEVDFGNKTKPWSMKGFSGYMAGSVQIGVRGEECVVRLSSDAAARSWREVVHLADNVSRIDLQATLQYGPQREAVIDRFKRQARANSKLHGDKRIVRWTQEHHGGYTLYLGDRLSNVFGRIYDKEVESKMDHYRGCVRFEAQYQRKLSKFVATSLSSKDSPMPTMAGYLSQFFSGRGCDLEIPYRTTEKYFLCRKRSDHDRSLLWLRKFVKPSVIALIDAGRGEEVLAALGLIDDGENNMDQLVQS